MRAVSGSNAAAEAGTLHRVRLARPDDVAGWRDAARACLAADVPPEAIVWESGGVVTGDLFGGSAAEVGGEGETGASGGTTPDLFGDVPPPVPGTRRGVVPSGAGEPARVPSVPRSFIELAERVVCHRAPDRFALLYRVLWRRARGEPALLACASDPDVHRLHTLGKRVARERHKMHAFVRFRRTPGVAPEHFGAWFEPEHHTLRLASGFFARRFANMRWSIVTPEESAHWDGERLVFGPGGRRDGRPDAEAMELLWQTYFANIFNPARLRLDAMRAEMPVKYWKNLPEAPLIADLVRRAGKRSETMIAASPSEPPRFAARATAAPAGADPAASAADTVTLFDDLPALHAHTRRCALCEHACEATQTVNGDGPVGAPLMLVGEQPGDIEDIRGRAFVGPAGALLRRVLEEEGIDPATLYLTNAVRHFRFEPRGKRRLHRRPDAEHVDRCRRWLFEEIRLVRPRVVLALGATAGRALLGRTVAVERERGRRFSLGDGASVRLCGHPAAVLRAADKRASAALETALRHDLVAAHADALAAARYAPPSSSPPQGVPMSSTRASASK